MDNLCQCLRLIRRRGNVPSHWTYYVITSGTPTSTAQKAHLSLSRLNHRLPRREAHPEIMQGTAQFHHQIADALFPQPEPVFDNATALHTAVDMLDP